MIESDLNRAPVLQLSYFNKECVLRIVASKSGLDAVLMQKYGDSLYSVTYSSRTLIAAERNYPTSGKECLWIVWEVQKFQAYLYGKHFVIQTNHQPLGRGGVERE